MKLVLILLSAAFTSTYGIAQALSPSDTVLIVTGDVTPQLMFTLPDLRKLPHRIVRAVDHDKREYTFEGVDVYRILSQAGIRFADTLRGKISTSSVLVVRAMDKYQTVFTLAELDPSNSDKPIILAYRQDGKPLSSKEGILRIISPHEKRHIRWVRQVQSFEVKHLD